MPRPNNRMDAGRGAVVDFRVDASVGRMAQRT
jgi:hypothetical protein